MSALFKETNLTDFELQKGCDVIVKNDDVETVFNVWCDSLEDDHTTIRVTTNNDDELLIVTVDKSDFKLPTISFSEDKSYCYVTFNNNSVHIKLDDEGVVFDVWDSTDDENGSIDTTYLFYGELEAKEEVTMNDFKIQSVQSVVGNDSVNDLVMFVLRFSFENTMSQDKFCDIAQDILYDEMGSTGNFRMAPKKGKDLTPDFIEIAGQQAKNNDFYKMEDNEIVAAFILRETDEDVSLPQELNAFSEEVNDFCKRVDASIEQLDVREIY